MKLKKFLALILAMCLVLALCACGAKNAPGTQDPNQSGQQDVNSGDTQSGTDGNQAGGVNFGLQTAPDPDFDSPSTGDDSGKLYTIVGDYAYELDPATLQPIGEPLDPVTHVPVSNPVLDGQNPSTPNNPQDDPDPVVTPDPTPDPTPAEPTPDPTPEPTVTPEPEQTLPNTGMFLEDD